MNNQLKSTLPAKEQSLFKRVVKCYEQKQFKNGLKFLKQIQSNPSLTEHGETLAMKGLILSCISRKDEAYECVKKGIKNDINSSICWHVYGLVQKADRKYDEAMRCYLRALKIDTGNLQILRDLSLLQVQMRHFEGYLNTRQQLFQSRPSQKASWLGYVVAQHLLGNYDDAIQLLDEFMKVQQNIPSYNYEHSELLIYYASILTESNKFEEAVKFLKSNSKQIVDKLFYFELLSELYMNLNNKTEAQKIYRDLIDRNPDNESYYMKLIESLELSAESEKLQLFDELINKYPKALMPQWIPLKLLPAGDQFRKYADSYLKLCLKKGVWALFVQVKFLYNDREKMRILENLYETYKVNIIKYQSLEDNTEDTEDPTTEIYINYLLGQHYNWLGKVSEALELVDNQLKHTPTLIEFFTLKGKIYYDAGNIYMASRCLDEAQSMDTADRYINCVCTKYMIEAGRIKDAEEMASKFTREGMRSLDNLNEMQCMWFLNTMARTSLRLSQYPDALQKCHEVNKHFNMMSDDQFDFHSYCLRKTTLRSYVALLRTEDRLQEHSFYFETARIAITIYLHLTDHPFNPDDSLNSLGMDKLTVSEQRKLKSKARKQQKRAESEAQKKQQEQEKKELAQKTKTTASSEEPEQTEEKIDGIKLAQTKCPLDEAVKFLQPLLLLSPDKLETQILAYHIFEKKARSLLMVRAIYRGGLLSESLNNVEYHECLIRFILNIRGIIKETSADDNDVFESVVNKLLAQLPFFGDNGKGKIVTLDEIDPDLARSINSKFQQRNKDSYLHQFYHWHLDNLINKTSKGSALKKLVNIPGKTENWRECQAVLDKLKIDYAVTDKDSVFQNLKSQFSITYPHCMFFVSSDTEDNQHLEVAVNHPHFNPLKIDKNSSNESTNGHMSEL